MKTTMLILLFLGLFFAACDDESPTLAEGDYLIFGSFYGECLGECVRLYKIQNGKLYIDQNSRYPSNQKPYSGDFKELSEEAYTLAKELTKSLPAQLWEESYLIGCPDCYDQGGLYVETQIGEEWKSWAIDQAKQDIPEYLHDFHAMVNEKLQALE